MGLKNKNGKMSLLLWRQSYDCVLSYFRTKLTGREGTAVKGGGTFCSHRMCLKSIKSSVSLNAVKDGH